MFSPNTFTIFSIADYFLSASQPFDVIYIETWVISVTNLKRYINGVEVDDISISTSRTVDGVENHFYGAAHGSNGGFSTYFRGELYDLKWYKNKALSRTEVIANYEAQKAL
jgi:trimethylamine:corrinoid methyltransferase-like protein